MAAEPNQMTLQTWWEEISFNGKEQYQLKENGELVLQPLHNNKERVIATFSTENADTILKALKDKFSEVDGKIKELETEWVAADDKLKLIGKVDRLKEYILHTNAIGDYDKLFQVINDWENSIQTLTEDNYKAKLKLVEQAEEVIASESWKETTNVLRDITEQWKKIGFLDKKRNDELWSRLEEARNKFFERKRTNHEEHEKEMLQNLDLKMELVEKAEGLAQSEDWKDTSEVFRQLMEQWKNTGRTIPEKNEELWNRFITAKNTFYDRKKEHFESIQQEQEANYLVKLSLVEKAEAMKDSTNWSGTAQAFSDIMEEWKNIGRVPAEKADELWNRLIASKEHFFNAKRQHFETFKLSLEDNLAQKMALLKRAEELKNSTRWHEATDEMNEMMVEWKKVGAVPREHSNTIWEQFLAARKYFFERKDANRERRKQHAERQFGQRINQSHSFLHRLEDELREEEEKLADFKNGLENITPGRKERELREHLTKLIEQTEMSVKRKLEKIDDVKKQLEELESKSQKTKETKGQKDKKEDVKDSAEEDQQENNEKGDAE